MLYAFCYATPPGVALLPGNPDSRDAREVWRPRDRTNFKIGNLLDVSLCNNSICRVPLSTAKRVPIASSRRLRRVLGASFWRLRGVANPSPEIPEREPRPVSARAKHDAPDPHMAWRPFDRTNFKIGNLLDVNLCTGSLYGASLSTAKRVPSASSRRLRRVLGASFWCPRASPTRPRRTGSLSPEPFLQGPKREPVRGPDPQAVGGRVNADE